VNGPALLGTVDPGAVPPPHGEAGTVLRVSHEDVLEPVGYAAGWHIHLDYLPAHLGGDDKPFADFWDPYGSLVDRHAAAAHRAPPAGGAP